MITLHGRTHPAVTLEDAVRTAGFGDAIALLTAPHAYQLARVHRGRCETCGDSPIAGEAFDARVFDGDRELRWLGTPDGEGQAVLLGEDPGVLPDGFGDPLPALHAVEVLPVDYLLRGRVLAGSGPWTTLHSPRTGPVHVPVPPPDSGARLRLVAREYVCVEPRHGNAHVAEERLLRIGPAEEARERTGR